nr:conserved phage C-terminal domain-containing protein [Escherichia coli]
MQVCGFSAPPGDIGFKAAQAPLFEFAHHNPYLRPQTLFQPSKFPGYLKSANSWNKAGRPARVNGEWAREDGIFKSSFQNTDYGAIPPGFRG